MGLVGSQFPDQGWNPYTVRQKCGILTTGLPEKSQHLTLFFPLSINKVELLWLIPVITKIKNQWYNIQKTIFLCVVIRLKIYSLNNFQVYNSIINYSHHAVIRSSKFIHLITGSLSPWTKFPTRPTHTPAPSNHHSPLGFQEFTFFFRLDTSETHMIFPFLLFHLA